MALIRKLPADYDNLVQVLYRLEDDKFKFKEIEKHLITEEGGIKQKRKGEGLDNVMNAYLTSGIKDARNNKIDIKSSKTGSKDESIHNRDQQYQRSCKDVVCNFCKKTGHIKKYCYALKRKEEGKRNFHNSNNHTEDNINVSQKNNNQEVHLNNVVKMDFDEWIIDNGATSHFCKEKLFFQNYMEIPRTKFLLWNKYAKSHVIGKGDVTFYLKKETKFIEIKLKNVLYAPNMRRNLISGVCMDIAGFYVKWKNNISRLTEENVFI